MKTFKISMIVILIVCLSLSVLSYSRFNDVLVRGYINITNGSTRINVTSCSDALQTDATGEIKCGSPPGVGGGVQWPINGTDFENQSGTLGLNWLTINTTIDARDNDTTYSNLSDFINDGVFVSNQTMNKTVNWGDILNTTLETRKEINSTLTHYNIDVKYLDGQGAAYYDNYDSVSDIPTATPNNGDTTHLSTADHIYDWVISLVYATKAYVDSIGNWTYDKDNYFNSSEVLALNDSWAYPDESDMNMSKISVGLLPLLHGGTGSQLSDPGQDRILFWDDSASNISWLSNGAALVFSGSQLYVQSASTTQGGQIELADDAETQAGTLILRAVTPVSGKSAYVMRANWSAHDDYPAACSGATPNVQGIGDTLSCRADSTNSTSDMINAVNGTALNGTNFKDIQCSEVIFSNGKGSAGICDGLDASGGSGSAVWYTGATYVEINSSLTSGITQINVSDLFVNGVSLATIIENYNGSWDYTDDTTNTTIADLMYSNASNWNTAYNWGDDWDECSDASACNWITDGNTNWDNSYNFITNTTMNKTATGLDCSDCISGPEIDESNLAVQSGWFNSSTEIIDVINNTKLNGTDFMDVKCSEIIFNNGKGNSAICDGDDATGGGGSGENYWIDGGTYIYPNSSYADDIEINGDYLSDYGNQKASWYNYPTGLYIYRNTSHATREAALGFTIRGRANTNTIDGIFGLVGLGEAYNHSGGVTGVYGTISAPNGLSYTGDVGTVAGVIGDVDLDVGGAITNIVGIESVLSTGWLGGAPTVTNAYYFKGFDNTLKAGSIANLYGIYIPAVTMGTSTNYAIYSAGGMNYFEGKVNVTDNVYATSFYDDGELLISNATMNKTVTWSSLQLYPAACPANTFLTELGDSVTCTEWNFAAYFDQVGLNKTSNPVFANMYNKTVIDSLGNWSADKSAYWNTSNDLDTVISDDEITEGKIEFSTACAAGDYYRLTGNDLECTTPTDTNTDTNASTACGDGEFLRGEAAKTCKTSAQIVTDGGGLDNTDTNASTACTGTLVLAGDGTCDANVLTEDQVEAYIFDDDNAANLNITLKNISAVKCIVFDNGFKIGDCG